MDTLKKAPPINNPSPFSKGGRIENSCHFVQVVFLPIVAPLIVVTSFNSTHTYCFWTATYHLVGVNLAKRMDCLPFFRFKSISNSALKGNLISLNSINLSLVP